LVLWRCIDVLTKGSTKHWVVTFHHRGAHASSMIDRVELGETARRCWRHEVGWLRYRDAILSHLTTPRIGWSSILRAIGWVLIWWEAWHKSLWRCIVKVFGLFPDAIMTLILESTLNTPETRSFVACSTCQRGFRDLSNSINYRRSDAPSGRRNKPGALSSSAGVKGPLGCSSEEAWCLGRCGQG
jgi:hypothetical protein